MEYQKNSFLILGAILSAIAALLHLACIYFGAPLFRFLGTEALAKIYESGNITHPKIACVSSSLNLPYNFMCLQVCFCVVGGAWHLTRKLPQQYVYALNWNHLGLYNSRPSEFLFLSPPNIHLIMSAKYHNLLKIVCYFGMYLRAGRIAFGLFLFKLKKYIS